MKRWTQPSDAFWPPLIIVLVFFASGQTDLAAPDFGFSIDKLAHFAVFGVLATSILRLETFQRLGWKGALGAALLTMLYGALDEYRQSFTPGRVVDLADWTADALGAMVAVTLYQGLPVYRRLLEWSPRSSA